MKKIHPILTLALLFSALAFASSACASTAVAVAGQTVTISYTLTSGTPPFTQQWKKNGANIPGATAPTYVIASFAAADSGTYTVVVSNVAGSATSDNAVLTAVVAPSGVVTGVLVTINGVTREYYPIG